MSPPPDPLGHIDSLLEVVGRAHEVIFTRYRRIIDQDGPDAHARQLVTESARIAIDQAAAAAGSARTAAQEYAIRKLLAPHETVDDAAMHAAVRAAEATLTELLRRQQQIAEQLSAIADR